MQLIPNGILPFDRTEALLPSIHSCLCLLLHRGSTQLLKQDLSPANTQQKLDRAHSHKSFCVIHPLYTSSLKQLKFVSLAASYGGRRISGNAVCNTELFSNELTLQGLHSFKCSYLLSTLACMGSIAGCHPWCSSNISSRPEETIHNVSYFAAMGPPRI